MQEGFGKPSATNFLHFLMLENGSTLVVFLRSEIPTIGSKQKRDPCGLFFALPYGFKLTQASISVE